MRIAFTICSNNYLAQAITLGNSFKCFHSDYEFIICLVDKLEVVSELIDSYAPGIKVITVEDIPIPGFNELLERYNITELNTAVKPYCFSYLFGRYKPEWTFYIDPDIAVYSRFVDVEKALVNGYEVVLTPHILTSKGEFDLSYLKEGLFNLGFVAFNNLATIFPYLKWWEKKVFYEGHFDYLKTQFYDQLWMNYAVCFLRKPFVLYHFGYNICGWNLFERKLLAEAGNYYVNSLNEKLVFYHYSGFRINGSPIEISKWCPSLTTIERPDVNPLIESYRFDVIHNGYYKFASIDCYFKPKMIPKFTEVLKYKVRFRLLRLLRKSIAQVEKL